VSSAFYFFLFFQSRAQDLDYAHKIVNELTSESYHGRGYVNDGDAKAAAFIKEEFNKLGLKPFADNFYQINKIYYLTTFYTLCQ
jgi:hypothetical protein